MILQRPRQATADAHAAIESHSVLLDPDLSRATARLFGCLFAIEGGALGGQVVTRHRQAFSAHLTAFARASDADDEIVAGANATLETLDRWLYPARPHHTPAQPAR